MENETIRTKASVSITVKYGNDYFKVETELNNETGISDIEINRERVTVKDLVTHAIDDYKQGEKQIKDTTPTFDADKNLEELLAKAKRNADKK